MFDSVSAVALRSALDGLAARQRATADNIANINTPHYLAARVDFEDALRSAVSSGSGSAAATLSRSVAPTREDGNNVNLDAETLSNIDTQLRYQLMTQAMDGKLTSITTALRTS
ncbi:flagellar basal body rod protein FlgB [Quadrisphaera sp. DSM 44207]|uniref:flagellar basal body rod protein FlgB n=1 Tax=Quadrisphaera sp. DSM 44207 TaxID=1881057 RepID=UPI0008908F0C|nr:flagellar basal body rod protein FlgB [Quadrisphaera sp. DSM 44207]SDQ20205.1 flagellar basal-body rod protein FlgB [Quadrisphaera sp. DSM 44207]